MQALEAVLVAKGYIDTAALDAYREWLQSDATAAIPSLGFAGRQGEQMVAVEKRADQHHLVVCTLCSCYPWPVLGLPPTWYKSAAYRSRAVRDPRGVLADFGVTLPDSTRIRVWDSTAELRYLVIPQQPAGTETLAMGATGAIVSVDAWEPCLAPRLSARPRGSSRRRGSGARC